LLLGLHAAGASSAAAAAAAANASRLGHLAVVGCSPATTSGSSGRVPLPQTLLHCRWLLRSCMTAAAASAAAATAAATAAACTSWLSADVERRGWDCGLPLSSLLEPLAPLDVRFWP
jgi:hypothetical protein